MLRRAVLVGDVSADVGALAHDDLQSLPVHLFPYVALAESLDATLATLDLRLSGAAGPRCAFATPDRP